MISYSFAFSCRNNYDIIHITIVMYYILETFKYLCTDSLKMVEFCQTYKSKQKLYCYIYYMCICWFYNEQFTHMVTVGKQHLGCNGIHGYCTANDV